MTESSFSAAVPPEAAAATSSTHTGRGLRGRSGRGRSAGGHRSSPHRAGRGGVGSTNNNHDHDDSHNAASGETTTATATIQNEGRTSGRGRGRERGGGGGRGGRGRNNRQQQQQQQQGNNTTSNESTTEATNGNGEESQSVVDVSYEIENTQAVTVTDNIYAGEDLNKNSSIIRETDVSPAVLSLPSPTAIRLGGKKKGVPVILSRHHANHQHTSATLNGATSEEAQEGTSATGGNDDAMAKKPVKKSRTKKKKKPTTNDGSHGENGDETGGMDGQTVEPPSVSTTQALENLPGQAVSITADTQVTFLRRSDSQGGAIDASSPHTEDPNHAFAHSNNEKATTTKTKPTKTGKKKKKSLSGSAEAQQAAARKFNNAIRAAVDASDLVHMRELLHDKRNHHYALEKNVLETVQKAFMTAALFDDALYCLRNCTLPGTLSLAQTERVLMCLPQNLRNSSAYTAADLMNALCIATEFDSAKKRTYFLRIVRGIALEFLEEATSARDRICSAPCERLVRAGLCVVDARLKRGKKAADLIVMPGNQLCFVPENMEQRGIAAGDAVSILPYAGPYPMSAESLDRNMIEATVINMNPMVLRLQDKMNTNLYNLLTEPIDGNVYRIDKLANRMGFNRQLAAAVAIASPIDLDARDFRRPCPQLIEAITSMDENIIRFNGALPRGEFTTTAGLCSEPIPWNVEDEGESFDAPAARESNRLALEKYGALEGLNPSQCLALEGATTNRLTLVQGPPGTGKTAVAIRILQHWARLRDAASKNGETPAPILATSDSNIAVDNLVEGCAAVGLRVVRLGRPEAVRPELLRYCIDRPPSQYGSTQGGGSQTQMAGYKERTKQMKNAQIICCTCIGSGSDVLDTFGPLEHILVDEATQATEAAILVPMTRGCRQLVLVGDHCQLPPTVLSTRAEEEGHGVPLFSRMVACGVPPFMLDTQYRMHPSIAQFPSDLFYGGLLMNGVSAPERRPLQGFAWPREEFPVAYVPVYGTEMDDGVSKYNEAEAAAACDAVAALISGGQCALSDIAVVTPYAAQARLIRRLIRQLIHDTGPPYVEVSSVDGFQGREKEAIVFSAVRSNDYGAIGFTSDWRRVNVSFTRARRALIVIGNDQTLRRGDPDTWMPWLAWADAHGVNMSNPGMPRGRYEPEQLRRVRGGTTAAEMLKDVLERQQAQLKTAEKEQERAEKNARGHIVGGSSDDGADMEEDGERNTLTLEEDLAQMANAEGNWDDSDDDVPLRHSASKATLTSAASSNDMRSGDDSDAVDIWDL